MLMLESNSLLSRMLSAFIFSAGGEVEEALSAAKFSRKGRPSTS
jgi:Ca2+/Na+ antiporter